MCNDFRNKLDIAALEAAFRQLDIPLSFPEGCPISSRATISASPTGRRSSGAGAGGGAELVQRRWSWPGPGGKPVYNFRGEGREFASGRCLIPADGFYEFTAPAEPRTDKRKDKWLFTMAGQPWFCIAGLWRSTPEVGEAFTMLTTPPGPDVAPYHNRQIAVLGPDRWAAWLDPKVPAREVIGTCPAGTLEVERAGG
jgi:putative SOS response-associated peptidase YedK